MMPRINISRVPPHLQTHPNFLQQLRIMESRLSKEDYLEMFAIHEYGHEHYFHEAGSSSFEYVPPFIAYDENSKDNPFPRQWAQIKMLDYTQPEGEDWLLKLAKGYAAGGECTLAFTTADDSGAKFDRECWYEMCRDCYKDDLSCTKEEIEAIAEETWTKARTAVRLELKHKALEVKIRAGAKKIMPQLFPWIRFS